MMKVEKCKIPFESRILEYCPVDYQDSFVVISDKDVVDTPDDLLVRFWTDMPGWVNVLFKLRNFLVRFVGLEGSNGESLEGLENCIRNGESYRFIRVVAKDEKETVMLMADKHLDAYISVRLSDAKHVFTNTLVKYNNGLGKFYW